ncbi:DUF222 domain-containing protein [Nocardioides nitrophenolicus]|uniref:DUF222 domain-containing protein n=1 Tax=Nocardioides nitrophenolicus TaxID=60489 RepID=UPI00195E3331|nr:DUF222 domain-containing protein [Nocardioides nitrophenolicus]MBM7515035.1 hypothetical protein [Nocardioides nitrophenolicus]
MFSDLSDATPERLLLAAEDGVRERRAAEVRQLELLLAWADLHSGDPQAEPDAVPVRFGGPRLVDLGGDGTPGVQDLALLEIAIARHEGVLATRNALADAFDLRHRLPAVWAGVRAGRCEVWVVRKVARMSRRLDRAQVRLVDTALAAALDQAPSRILAIAEAKIIEADPIAHHDRIEKNRRLRGVWYPQPRPGSQIDDDTAGGSQAGIGTVFARLDEADALEHARMVANLATALAEHAPPPADGQVPLSMDHWRAEAFAMLADPAAVLTFLSGPAAGDGEDDGPSDAVAAPAAELVVHVALTDADAFGPVARVEGLGPRLLTQVRELLNHHTRRHATVSVTPVIDLHAGRSVSGYEHPTDVKRRTELRTVGDMFPHATGLFTKRGRSPDHDHTTPYDTHGPPGQTGDHNDTPLARHHHRAKTHVPGYTVLQLGPDRWVWGTPHGLYRLVTGGGTRPVTQAEYHLLAGRSLVLMGDLAA